MMKDLISRISSLTEICLEGAHLWSIQPGLLFFYDGGRYHIETSPLSCSANRWTGFYMLTAYVIKELNHRRTPVKIEIL